VGQEGLTEKLKEDGAFWYEKACMTCMTCMMFSCEILWTPPQSSMS
jgi:homoaconitase/3-isopropylmalate dehydratase large subunit